MNFSTFFLKPTAIKSARKGEYGPRLEEVEKTMFLIF
jgi:hypothetical protein